MPAAAEPAFDWRKPAKERSGNLIRVLAVDAAGDRPLVVAYDDGCGEGIRRARAGGTSGPDQNVPHPFDVLNDRSGRRSTVTQGVPVRLRCGRPARLICADRTGGYPFVVLVTLETGVEEIVCLLPSGEAADLPPELDDWPADGNPYDLVERIPSGIVLPRLRPVPGKFGIAGPRRRVPGLAGPPAAGATPPPTRPAPLVDYPNRSLGFRHTITPADATHDTGALANIALSNLRPGEVLRLGPRQIWTVVGSSPQVLTLETFDGVRARLKVGDRRWEQLARDAGGLLLASHHGVDAGDLLKALMRDPAAFRTQSGALGLRDRTDRVLETADDAPAP